MFHFLKHFLRLVFSSKYKKEEKLVTCPRCLGKKYVAESDIRRLNMYLKWGVGHCAYCNAKGIVTPEMIKRVPINLSYLTINTSKDHRDRLFQQDNEIIKLAILHDLQLDKFIEEIISLSKDSNFTPEEIRDYYVLSSPDDQLLDQNELLEYIHKVLKQKA